MNTQRDSLTTEVHTDHFMVGEHVRATVDSLEVDGEIQAVVEHTVREDGGAQTVHKRVLVDLGDREINVSSADLELSQ